MTQSLRQTFGQTQSGLEVQRVALAAHGFTAHVLTLGAILQDFRTAHRPLTLGAPDLAAYDHGPMRYFGAVIGPVAGRISGAAGQLEGATLMLEANEGANTLHSAGAGLHQKVWQIEAAASDAVTLSIGVAPGEGGLPGARRFRATYALEPAGLRLTLMAETDAPTWVNLTQHSYWHLGGAPGIDGHSLQVAADRYLPIDAATLPTGEIAAVAGTAFDFRSARRLTPQDRLDHCFCLDTPGLDVPAARLSAPDGTILTLSTDAPGLQIHTGDGVGSPSRPGLALEAQGWPDAPNHPGFPSIRLDPGRVWRSETLFRISESLPARR